MAATTAWNVQGNRVVGVKHARKALDVLKAGPHKAKVRAWAAGALPRSIWVVVWCCEWAASVPVRTHMSVADKEDVRMLTYMVPLPTFTSPTPPRPPPSHQFRSEVASSLADMLYALNRWDEALEAVGEAMTAAREAHEWALAVKLSNNMGAVYKKLGRWGGWCAV